jgi:PhnB protein
MPQLNPYLTFNGNCRAAMEFYHACLGGELSIMTVGESQMKEQMPPSQHNNVMHSALNKDGMVLMASDLMMTDEFTQGNAFTICISAGSVEELKPLFTKLSAGGTVGHELTAEFFGTYGDFIDKFGVRWAFQSDEV